MEYLLESLSLDLDQIYGNHNCDPKPTRLHTNLQMNFLIFLFFLKISSQDSHFGSKKEKKLDYFSS